MLSNPKHVSDADENAVYSSIITGQLHDEMPDDFAGSEVNP